MLTTDYSKKTSDPNKAYYHTDASSARNNGSTAGNNFTNTFDAIFNGTGIGDQALRDMFKQIFGDSMFASNASNHTTIAGKTTKAGETTTVGKTTTMYDKYANSTAIPSNIDYLMISPESHPCKYLADCYTGDKSSFDISLVATLLNDSIKGIIEFPDDEIDTNKKNTPEAEMILMMIHIIKRCFDKTESENKRRRVVHTVRACRRVAIFMLDHARPIHEGYDLELPTNILKDIIDIIEIYHSCVYTGNVATSDLGYPCNSALVETLVCNNLNFHDCVINEIYRYSTDET